MRIKVTLNGGPVNVWHELGLRCNPFPQIAKHEFAAANRMLQELDADPLPDAAAVRRILTGCDPQFVDLCMRKFTPGERVAFVVTWPDEV